MPLTAAAPQEAPPNITYIAIGSVMGCLVLMTVVVIAILYTNRQKRSLHYTPTTMSAVPTNAFADIATNPISTRVLFPPQQTRGITTITD
jgi:hypothetical protein